MLAVLYGAGIRGAEAVALDMTHWRGDQPDVTTFRDQS